MKNLSYTEVVTTPNYLYVFNFEKNFVYMETKKWMQNNLTNSIYYCIIYVILVFGGKYYMLKRQRFNLRGALVLWSSLLSLFSIIGLSRTLPEMIHILTYHGFYHSVCIPSFIEQDVVSGFWAWMFALSKLLEFGDTIFIVLRKQELIFLHWYHHITVFLYTWFSYADNIASARWFMVLNYFVHSIMYSYYALKAMRYKTPVFIPMLITILQITQMILGCIISIVSYHYLESHKECKNSRIHMIFSILMYLSYFILFCKFFYKSYIDKNGKFQKKMTINGTMDHKKFKAN
ncbi:elongation of very long chain fatty acids protein 6-like [Apis mellifera]|uniref:Elongation of very long chain fatty acids protein n=1 Tax=Apis mellifera TaxID=7460 RepID=A0A7M7MNN0_APIME|nr:elongation of very long chain fatty acids protein 6-like [Apis mellifera]|eukprot:XP_026298534.1 elongation of very long chain fatty acids protein 6-like [Apis mellifera]